MAVRIVDAVMLALTVVCTLLLIAAYLARYVDPRRAWLFAFPGLVFPAIYIAEMLLGLMPLLVCRSRSKVF